MHSGEISGKSVFMFISLSSNGLVSSCDCATLNGKLMWDDEDDDDDGGGDGPFRWEKKVDKTINIRLTIIAYIV